MRVFISYSHTEDVIANEIVEILDALSVPCFRDVTGVGWGDELLGKIHKAIRDCTHLLIIVSPASTESQWVPYETGFAVAEGKFVLPYLAYPKTPIPDFLRHLHYKQGIDQLRSYFETELADGIQTKERLEQLLVARKYRLIFNPPDRSKNMQFAPNGHISVGRKPKNENTWRIVNGKLELVQDDQLVHSRFYYDDKQDKFIHTNDSDTNSFRGQILEPIT